MGSLFSKLFSKKSAEASAKAPTPPAAPAQPPPGTAPSTLPRQPGPGAPKLQVPVGATPAAGGIKIPKKRITQRITVTPGGGNGPASPAIPVPGLAPSMPVATGMPTLKIAIPAARKTLQPQAPASAVATTVISAPAEASLQIPLHTLVKALPQETLRVDREAFLQTPEAQEMASLPLANILAMLPSGKIDWNARELVSYIPSHVVLTPDEVPEGLNVSLPLASVVGRIPPEYLALRPDQRSVDPAVTAMADPFSQEVLAKLAAEAAAKNEAEVAAKAAAAAPFETPAAMETPVPVETPAAIEPPVEAPAQPALRPVPKSIGAMARVTQVAPMMPPAPLPSFTAPSLPIHPPAPAAEPSSFKFDLPPVPSVPVIPEPLPVIPEPTPEPEISAGIPEEKSAEPVGETDLGALAQSDSFRALLEKANAEAEQETQAAEPAIEPELPDDISEPVSTEPESLPSFEEPAAPEAAIHIPELAPEEIKPEPVAIEPEPVIEPSPEVLDDKPTDSFADSFKKMAAEVASKEKEEISLPEKAEFTPEDSLPPAPVSEPEPEIIEEPVVEPAPEAKAPDFEAFKSPVVEEPIPEFKAPEPEVVKAPEPEIAEAKAEVELIAPELQSAPEPEPAPEPEAKVEPEPPKIEEKSEPVIPEPIRTPLPPLQPSAVIRPNMVPLSPFKPKASEPAKLPGQDFSGEENKKEIRISLNRGTVEDFVKIAGVTPRLARKILAWRELHGDFTELSQLLGIPGLTQEIYRQFTGDPDSDTAISAKVNLSLGLPLDRKLTIKDIAAHIRRWPSISGCIIAGSEGLLIAKDMVDPELSQSLAAFLPKIMQNLNDTLSQIKALPAEEVHIGTEEVGFFIYYKKGMFMVMLSTEKDLPEYYGKVVRSILHELTEGKITRVDL